MSGIFNDLGPCEVWFDEAKLGVYDGDVIFRETGESRPVHEAEKGVTEVDSIRVGKTVEVEMSLTRESLAKLATILPGATLPSETKIDVYNNAIGTSRYDNAKELIIKPIEDGAVSANTKWLTIPKASPEIDSELMFNNDNQRVWKVVFKAFPDASTGKLYTIGA